MENADYEPQDKAKERMRDENSPNVNDSPDDCIGKQHGGWMSLVATTGATNATGFAPTAAATADPGTGEIVGRQIYYVTLFPDRL